jgi:hypothetical protein
MGPAERNLSEMTVVNFEESIKLYDDAVPDHSGVPASRRGLAKRS